MFKLCFKFPIKCYVFPWLFSLEIFLSLVQMCYYCAIHSQVTTHTNTIHHNITTTPLILYFDWLMIVLHSPDWFTVIGRKSDYYPFL